MENLRQREKGREIFFNCVKLEQCEALKEPCLWLRAPQGSKRLLDACVFSFILYLLLDWMEGLKGFWTLVREWQGVSGAQRFMSCSVVDAVRRIVAEEGLSALLRGLRPRVLFHTPAAAICWSTYEAGKSFLSNCDWMPKNLIIKLPVSSKRGFNPSTTNAELPNSSLKRVRPSLVRRPTILMFRYPLGLGLVTIVLYLVFAGL